MVPIMVPLQYFQMMTSASVTTGTASVTSASVTGSSVDVNITSGKIKKIGAVRRYNKYNYYY